MRVKKRESGSFENRFERNYAIDLKYIKYNIKK